jgi:hypothetical protein
VSSGRRSTALILALASLGLGTAVGIGCGGDDSTEVTLPTISVEQDTQAVPDQTTTTESAPTESQNGGTGSYDQKQPDSQTNDKPPPAGSPEEAFENACKQNPAACG